MSESKHTPGLCRVEQDTTLIWSVCNDDPSTYGMEYPIAECRITPAGQWANGPDVDEGVANARRLVAAVNACANIGTEALEAGVVAEMVEQLKRLSAFSDETLVLLSDKEAEFFSSIWEKLDAILAKIGGAS